MSRMLSVRVDDDLFRDLELLVKARGSSLSAVVREAVGAALQSTRSGVPGAVHVPQPETPGDIAPTAISVLDRHQLALLHRIARALDSPARAQYHLGSAEALERGDVRSYPQVFAPADPESILG